MALLLKRIGFDVAIKVFWSLVLLLLGVFLLFSVAVASLRMAEGYPDPMDHYQIKAEEVQSPPPPHQPPDHPGLISLGQPDEGGRVFHMEPHPRL
jgi:hypothetical protein